MKGIVAIHQHGGFVDRWRESAVERGRVVRLVDGRSSDILSQLEGCEAFLWHLSQDEPVDLEFARSVLISAEEAGVRVFPNHATCWHFDDKIAQKYLLEAIGAPLARTWVFYSKNDALSFIESATLPLVFKLRRGAGSMNVRLIVSPREGCSLIQKMFGRGMSPHPRSSGFQRAAARLIRDEKRRDIRLAKVMRVARRLLRQAADAPPERGYFLVQEFIAGNDHDVRATVIGDRCFVFRRGVRSGDFRASGSGKISNFTEEDVPPDVVEESFQLSRKLGFQSMAYDFVRRPGDGRLVLLEMSFVFNALAVAECPGHLDAAGRWHQGSVWPESAIVEDLLR